MRNGGAVSDAPVEGRQWAGAAAVLLSGEADANESEGCVRG